MRAGLVMAVLAVCGMAQGVWAQENMRWNGEEYAERAYLAYGVPETDHVRLFLSCERGGDVAFTYAFEPINATDGVVVTVSLEAGGISLPIEATGVRLEMDDLFILEAEIPLDDRLLDVLTAQGTLSVFVEDGSEDFPLDGARAAAKPLARTCGPA